MKLEIDHPIGYAARRSGLSTHVIRVWERRYGAVTPAKSTTNRRRYTDAEIERLRTFRLLIEAGHSIGGIAHLDDQQLHALLASSISAPARSAAPTPAGNDSTPETLTLLLRSAQEAIQSFDAAALNAALAEARLTLDEQTLLEGFVGRLIAWVGDGWHDGDLRISHEHLATATIRTFLARLRLSVRADTTGPVVVVGTPAGELHELGAMLAATVAALEGWNSLYLGPDLPAVELASSMRQASASVLALSIAVPANGPRLLEEMEELMQLLPRGTVVLMGGAGARWNQRSLESLGVECLDGLSALRLRLQSLRKT